MAARLDAGADDRQRLRGFPRQQARRHRRHRRRARFGDVAAVEQRQQRAGFADRAARSTRDDCAVLSPRCRRRLSLISLPAPLPRLSGVRPGSDPGLTRMRGRRRAWWRRTNDRRWGSSGGPAGRRGRSRSGAAPTSSSRSDRPSSGRPSRRLRSAGGIDGHGTLLRGATVLSNAAPEDNRRARRRRAAAADRRRIPVAARQDDARQARVGARATPITCAAR